MFREMRRITQQLPDAECVEILQKGSSGVLAVLGDEGYPYAVPLSYVCKDGKIYFHCAKTGHKLDAIAGCDKVSFCVVAQDNVAAEEYTTYFKSVIAFGRARVLEDTEEKIAALSELGFKYSPGMDDTTRHKAKTQIDGVCIIALTIENMTGKEAIELTRQRKKD